MSLFASLKSLFGSKKNVVIRRQYVRTASGWIGDIVEYADGRMYHLVHGTDRLDLTWDSNHGGNEIIEVLG